MLCHCFVELGFQTSDPAISIRACHPKLWSGLHVGTDAVQQPERMSQSFKIQTPEGSGSDASGTALEWGLLVDLSSHLPQQCLLPSFLPFLLAHFLACLITYLLHSLIASSLACFLPYLFLPCLLLQLWQRWQPPMQQRTNKQGNQQPPNVKQPETTHQQCAKRSLSNSGKALWCAVPVSALPTTHLVHTKTPFASWGTWF